MSLRHVPFGEHEIIALHAADVDLVLVEKLATLGSPFFADDDREHARMAGLSRKDAKAFPTERIHLFWGSLSTTETRCPRSLALSELFCR